MNPLDNLAKQIQDITKNATPKKIQGITVLEFGEGEECPNCKSTDTEQSEPYKIKTGQYKGSYIEHHTCNQCKHKWKKILQEDEVWG